MNTSTKLKNNHQGSLHRYYNGVFSNSKKNITNLEKVIRKIKVELTTEYDKLNRETLEGKSTIRTRIRILGLTQEYADTKHELQNLIKNYKKAKSVYKQMQRACEERWMNGFAEGVQFILETLENNQQCSQNDNT